MTTLLDIRNVSKRFHLGGLLSRDRVDAVRDVSFSIRREDPEIFTVIGESGSGKTTLARMILGLEQPSEGTILFDGAPVPAHAARAARHRFMTRMQPVFQNPFEAFNPLKQVDRYLFTTATALLGATGRQQMEAAVDRALHKVGLSLTEIRGRFPHELSGGQLQRVAIARALIPNPALLIADEPVSMVDASLRMSIVNLLRDLRERERVSVIYITHDLATAYYISDRLIIMQKGQVVEMGEARAVLDAPEHPYSRLLKQSALSVDDAGAGRLKPSDRAEAEAHRRSIGAGRLTRREDGRLVRVA